jgi:hypothetical protein
LTATGSITGKGSTKIGINQVRARARVSNLHAQHVFYPPA